MRIIFVIGFLFALLYASCDYVYQIKYVDVPLDHFNFNDNRTFKLRFLINDTYWKGKSGPIFFYTGNEGDVKLFAQNTGFLWDVAKQFRALVVFAEHRYYGESLPFGNLSLTAPQYFGYLTSQQALADYVDVIYFIKSGKWDKKRRLLNAECRVSSACKKDVPVIAFGGSYGGMLAAWFRMKYPAVVQGALASSAPIWMFPGMNHCAAAYEVLSFVYNSTHITDCANVIKKSWKVITNFGKSDSGRNWIKENWKLCDPVKNDSDITNLKNYLQELYFNVAMTNYPYPTNFLAPLPANPVKAICSFLTNASLPDEELLMSVFRGISVYFNGTETAKCLNWQGESAQGIDESAWNIQTCTELVMPMCTNGVTDIFEPNPWNFTEVTNDCYTKYKVKPVENLAEKIYGGKRIKAASNIIFSNGLLDPWMSGGVLHNVSSSVIALVLTDSAHHLDLRASNPNDPLSVRRARLLYKSIFKRWIKHYDKKFRTHYKD